MQRTHSSSVTRLLISFVIVYSIMPIVSRITSMYLSTYVFLLIILLLYFIIMLGQRSRFNQYFNILLPMIFFEAVTFFLRSDSLVLWGYKVLLFLMPVVVGYYLIYENYDNRFFTRIILIALVITTITTIIGVRQYPYASRYLATVQSADEPLAVLYGLHNIGGYDFVYTVVLLYPLLIYAYKRGRINLIVFAIGASSVLALTIFTEYTTALLLFMMSSVLFFVKRDMNDKTLRILLVAGAVFLLVFSSFASGLLQSLSSRIQSQDISERLLALAGGRTGLENTEDQRLWLYRKSINTFLSNPLLGTFLSGGRESGGHSAILDTLAKYGILGMFLLVQMYKKIYRVFYAPFRDEEGYGYYLWLFLQAILLSVVNTGLSFQILSFYAPMIFIHITKKGDCL